MGSGKSPIVDMGVSSVLVAVVQASTVFYDTPATLDKAEKLLREAASSGAQLVVFPEAFIGGYPCGLTFSVSIGNRTPKGNEDLRRYHTSAVSVYGPEVEHLAAMARKYKVYLVMGVIEKDGYTLYSTVLFINSSGHYLGKHRKIMPTPCERMFLGYGNGSTIPVFDTPIGKISAAISRENRTPLLRATMYAKGVEIYCATTAAAVYSVATFDSLRDVLKECMTHIVLEGGCFVLSANQFCRRRDYPPSPDTIVCAGGCVIISPTGELLAGPSYEGDVVLCANLDRQEIARAKFDFDRLGTTPDLKFLACT